MARATLQHLGSEKKFNTPLAMISGSMGLFIIANALELQRNSLANVMFGVMVLVIVSSITLGLLRTRGVPRLGSAMTVWTVVLLAAFLQFPTAPHASFQQTIVDLVITLLPVGVAIAVGVWLDSRRQIAMVLIVVTVSSLIGAVLALFLGTSGSRISAPTIYAIVGTWLLATARLPVELFSPEKQRVLRVLALISAIGLLFIVLESRQRTALAVWAVSCLVAIIFTMPRSSRWLLALAIVPVSFLGLAIGNMRIDLAESLPGVVEQARLGTLVAGQYTEAGGDRMPEIRDVAETMSREGGVLDYTLGFGHGATYLPETSIGGASVDPETGRAHQIHVTPVMVWFRYGIVGVIAFAFLMASTVRSAYMVAKRERGFNSMFLLLTAVMYCVDMLLRVSFVDPGFALTLALVALYRYSPKFGGMQHG